MIHAVQARASGPSTGTRQIIVTAAPPGRFNLAPKRVLLMLLLRAAETAETAEEPFELEPEPATSHQPEPVEA
jgi:hypothetical protein